MKQRKGIWLLLALLLALAGPLSAPLSAQVEKVVADAEGIT
ncbi:MAG TPA: hypothetical protein VJ417_13040 [Candidatus Glassbacteria bacterium]|nr:hypothetical protein [Candidatus Glassbacteria bacterium]